MRFVATFIALVSCLVVSVSATTCKVTASGGDDAPAFLSAVQKCTQVTIDKDTTLNISTRLNMTGLNDRRIKLKGTIKFNPDIAYWAGNGFSFPFQTQITFWIFGGNNIRIDGGGTIDGSGQAWYDAFAANSSLLRPITLTVFQAQNVVIEDITMLNSPEWFNFVNEGKHVSYNNIRISATTSSVNRIANTDGWDVYRSDDVSITNSNINNGDDCVSFKPNATNIIVNNLVCNGSHGISVGSLGQFPGVFDIVENVTASNIRISNAQNGARIKAWAGPNVGSGIVKNIVFEHFIESNNDNPVIIDQCYMTNATACAQFPSNTFIQNVVFNDISGTSSGSTKSVVASLKCSPDGRCEDVTVSNFNLTPPAIYAPAAYACQNVNLTGNAAGLFGTCTTT
ncbi:glycoside hydrolase family 28 protein [Rickenella mellea]|uniref:galacturonan 1,4-alpha-galacturonidase n=1 Tax=Rickenella mellea TaxID=50990 RepID=A0A4Y7PSF6_9AGAM|nr:glycoside hydrolase family 28 protein [Rickenella mellea]